MHIDIGLVVAGLVVLTLGGELALRGAVGLAMKIGVSPAMIGLTVVGFGTSAPELMVTVQAALADQPDLAVGNVVGSNIANILLILGVGGCITSLTCSAGVVRRDATAMLLSIVLLTVLGWHGIIEAWHGAIMIILLVAYMTWSYFMDKRDVASAALHEREAEETENVPENAVVIAAFLLVGLAGLVGGAHLLVDGATSIARAYGVPESIIGLTLVALGTSLPELAATVVAAVRGHSDVAIANVLGSCLFNVLSILGITALIKPLTISPDIQSIDMWVMLAAAAVVIPMLWKDNRIARLESILLLAGYTTYIGFIGFRLGIV